MDPERVQRKEQRAREALARLQKGEPFAQVAAAYSDAQDALQGGSLGWRPLSRIPTIFASTAPQMKVGEISELLRSGNGFHIFAVMDRRGKSVAETVTQYHLREILMRLESNQPESEIRAKLSGVRARVMAGEDFSALAKLVSEDENRTKGGDIGWVAKGETFPEFDRVMVDLGPGQVSDIVKTQLGLHLVQVVEKRQTDLGEERRRVQAKQGVRARKVDEAFDEWVRQIRDSAFVDYRQSDGGAL
jgi:peptidyl-prolyl cis-trans isomerase SurA